MNIENSTEKEKRILELLQKITDREKIIIELRYDKRRTQAETGKLLKITNERVRQLEDRILSKIKKVLK